MKHFLAIAITLLPSAVLAEQFTPQQMIDVMTKSPSNRDVRVGDVAIKCPEDSYWMYKNDSGGNGVLQCAASSSLGGNE